MTGVFRCEVNAKGHLPTRRTAGSKFLRFRAGSCLKSQHSDRRDRPGFLDGNTEMACRCFESERLSMFFPEKRIAKEVVIAPFEEGVVPQQALKRKTQLQQQPHRRFITWYYEGLDTIQPEA